MDYWSQLRQKLGIWKSYTMQEVREKKKNNWLVVDGHVIDVTPFLNKHPAGADILREHCGSDASTIFDKVCHSNQAYEQMLTLKIGILASPS